MSGVVIAFCEESGVYDLLSGMFIAFREEALLSSYPNKGSQSFRSYLFTVEAIVCLTWTIRCNMFWPLDNSDMVF